MIPIYLIVAGSIGLLSTSCACAVAYREDREDRVVTIPPQPVSPYWHVIKQLRSLVLLLLFAWFIAGNVWIYKNYEPNYTDPKSPYFCHKTLYLFAFWVINSYYILFGGVFVIVCVTYIISCFFSWTESGLKPTCNKPDKRLELCFSTFDIELEVSRGIWTSY